MRRKKTTKKKTEKRAEKKVTIVTLDLAAESRLCDEKANYLLGYMDLPTVDFITDAIVDAIAEAGELVSFPTPTFAPEESDDERRRMLAELFSQAPRIRLRDDKYKVLRATLELLHNPQTPADLYEHVAEFVCDSFNRTEQHGPRMLTVLLDAYPADELRGAVIAAREETRAEG